MEGLIDIGPYYLEFGSTPQERQKRYQENVEGVMKERFLINIRKQLDEGIFGRPEFVRGMKEKFKIKSMRPRGRPKKDEK